MESLSEVGQVTHYYSKIGVAVIQLKAPLNVGDIILIKGATTNLEQRVESMEIEHRNVDRAEAGQSVGLKVKDKVREKDIVYRKISS
ncbi:translation elongation factor-like protein [Candidatus Bathyarchaeota archaeon]|nr:translation elongation factor-like protein [Candidatus Bathyarchaeota archaeon]MBS7628908.1 translation elongation factor-like protein [Candidatus Bathyarchaeota archaeon]